MVTVTIQIYRNAKFVGGCSIIHINFFISITTTIYIIIFISIIAYIFWIP